jgi:site-specific recombinase XerD
MVALSRQLPGKEGTMVDPARIRVTGPLVAHRQGLWDALLALGYRPLSAGNLLRVTAHLSRWLQERGLSLAEVTSEGITAFFEARRRAGYTQFLTPRALAPILGYLRQAGAVPPPPAAPEPTGLDRVLHDYTHYLLHERALTVPAARAYGDVARRFLGSRFTSEPPPTLEITAREVTSFVLATASRYATGTTKYVVTALRALLRYLYLEGRLAADLTGAVPAVAGWRLRGLPTALAADQVPRLLRSCDRRRGSGRRDHAVLLLLVRLGLRAGEVAGLSLDDIDWPAGEVLIRGKGRREDRLPLPADVGAALAHYLRTGRPRTIARQVFLGTRAPHRALSPAAVSTIARQAGVHAGLPATSAHRLRRTAATELLRGGASLDEIAQVLRHRSHDTTAIYAKVDHRALRAVIRPWPGAAL